MKGGKASSIDLYMLETIFLIMDCIILLILKLIKKT